MIEEQLIEESIKNYPKYSAIQDPLVLIFIGVFITISCGIWFARLMQIKLINWEQKNLSPLPLRSTYTVLSWSGSFTGLTLFFCGMLQIFDFATSKSLIASMVISMVSGSTMWRVIKDLMNQLDSGNIKEIDQYF